MRVLKKSLDIALDQRYTEMDRWKHRRSTPASMLAADPTSWNSGFLPEEKVPIDPIVCIPGTVWPIVPEPVEAPVLLPEPSATGSAHVAGASAPSSSTPARGAAAEALVEDSLAAEAGAASAASAAGAGAGAAGAAGTAPGAAKGGVGGGAEAGDGEGAVQARGVSKGGGAGDLRRMMSVTHSGRKDLDKVMDMASLVAREHRGYETRTAERFSGRVGWEDSFKSNVNQLMVDFKLSSDPTCRLHHLDRMYDWFHKEGGQRIRKPAPPSAFLTFDDRHFDVAPGSLRGSSSSGTSPAEATVGLANSWRTPYARRLENNFNIVPGPPPPGPGYK